MDRILSATVPTKVTSGKPFTIKVDYESMAGGSLELSVDDGFAVAPASVAITPSTPGSITFQATITRGTATSKHTTLKLVFGNVHESLVEVA